MMEIWIRSIARAGGVEMPASARVMPETRPRRRRARRALAKSLRSAGRALVGAAERLSPETGPALRRC